MNFRKNQTTPQVTFQMAPMIDVMFLLLIFFMVVSIYAQWETKVGITLPTADSGVPGNRREGEIIINVDKDGRIFVNDAEMTLGHLESLLAKIAETYRAQPVIIRADGATRHDKVVAVLDVCRKVDIWNVAFATLPNKKAGG
ncbi:MAG: biopolymer transporter ExbD [Kiritimatiellaeota bacterium]|nr:biopolymer transporter ExbD [Kiritimatiellota bacterium]